MLTESLYHTKGVIAVICGSKELLSPVAFRCANEASLAGGRTIYICRSNSSNCVPRTLRLLSVDSVEAEDPFPWSLRLLQNIDVSYANNSRDLRRLLGKLQTLSKLPDLIVVESFSELIDPLFSSTHSDYEFLNQALRLRHYLDDAADAIGSLSGRRVRVLITDPSPISAPVVGIITRAGETVALVAPSSVIGDVGGRPLELKVQSSDNRSATSSTLLFAIRDYMAT